MNYKEFNEHIKNHGYIEFDSKAGRDMQRINDHTRKLCRIFNSKYRTQKEILKMFGEITGQKIDPTFSMYLPFYAEYGKNIRVGKHAFINSCCCFQDQGGISIGDYTLVGQHVVITTVSHGLGSKDRWHLTFKPVKIGNNV